MRTNLREILNVTKAKLIGPQKNITIEGISIDSRTIKAKEIFLALKGNNFDGHDFIREAVSKGACCIIASKKEIINQIINEFKDSRLYFPVLQVSDTLKALVDLATYNRRKNPVPVIAITGTNGKTTTKDMAAAILSSRYNVLKNEGTQNNKIGLCLSLLKLNKMHQLAVLELGTNHPGEIQELSRIASANVGIITNIGPGHLEFFSNIKNVFKEKYSLLKKLKVPAIKIINADDPYLWHIKRAFSFALRNKSDIRAENIISKNGKTFFIVNKTHNFILNTIAQHNVYNALAAIICGLFFGIDIKSASEALADFSLPASRFNILELDNMTIFDDTYNSNPASLKAAIDALSEYPTCARRILVMADMLELGKDSLKLHCSIARLVARSNIDYFITMGKFSRHAAQEAKRICRNSKKIINCNSPDEISSILIDTVDKNDVVLIKGSRAMQMEKVIASLKEKDK